MRASLGGIGALLLAGLVACGPHVEGHAVATHSPADHRHVDASAVRISALVVPPGAEELGIVQAHTVGGTIEDAMPEFRAQVAGLGGDFGKVNDITTKFEIQTRTRNETYNCGTSDKPRSCTRTVTENAEVATTRILGKAYRLNATPEREADPDEAPPSAPSPAPSVEPSSPSAP